DHARVACAEGLCRQRCDGGHRSHSKHESDEQDQVREADGGNGTVAEPPNECEVGRHHGDLAELGQRDGPRELDRFDDRAPAALRAWPPRWFPAMSSRGTIADAMATERRGTRGSVALGCDEKLAIAVAARDGRGHDACDAPAERSDEGGDIVADRGVN